MPASSRSTPVAVFIGPMGSGKTKIGSFVAKALGLPFTDTDKVIAKAHGPISEIFAAHGEQYFRAIEQEVVLDSLCREGIVSLGGGAVLAAPVREALKDLRVVFLTADADAVLARISTSSRPLIANDPTVWQRIFAERESIYLGLATITFDTTIRPITGVAARITNWLEGEL